MPSKPIVSALFLGLLMATAPVALSGQEPFKVGLVTSLTGAAADYGISIRNSINLAKDDRPELFEHIQFIDEDVGYDTKQAVIAFQKLVNVDRVDIVFTWGFGFCQALAPIAEAAGVPLVAECIDPHISKDRRYVLRFFNYSDEYLSRQSIQLKDKNLDRIALITADTPYLAEMSAALKRNLKNGQTIVFEESVLPTETDFRTLLTKIRRSQAQTIGVFLSTGQIGQFYKQAGNLAVKLPTFGTNWFESLSEVRAAEGAMDGAVFVNTDVKPAFIGRYIKVYGNQSTLAFGAPAYELALVIGKLFGRRASRPSAAEIMQAFAQYPEERGVASGPFTYVDSPVAGKYFRFPIAVKRVAGDKFEVIQ